MPPETRPILPHTLSEQVAQRIKAAAPSFTQHRRALHRIPETGFQELRTAAHIATALEGMGLTPCTGIAGTGVTALLDTGLPGPDTILRADMDALPVCEASGLDFASEHQGCMHACGHDAHMAMLLGAAEILTQLARHVAGAVTGRVLFLFQPAEEGHGGAEAMIRAGVLAGLREPSCFAAHVWPVLPTGTIGIKPGPLMAAMDSFKLTVHGKGGHAATPHLCIDALDTSTQVVGALQRIVSRMSNPLEPVLLTVGELHAGHAYNVIPGEAYMTGTVRTFSPAIRSTWETRIRSVADGVCSAMGATATLDFRPGHGPVLNDATLAALVRQAVVEAAGEAAAIEPEPSLCGEDFSCFLELMPGCLFFVGCGGESAYPLHNPQFTIDEHCLPLGVEVFIRTVLLRCAEKT